MKVCAASVRAIVAEVPGKVIVVPSVPSRDKLFNKVRVFEEVPPAIEKPVVWDARVRPFTDVGVIAPALMVIAGVVVALETVPENPLAVFTETEVTVPDEEEGVCQVAAVPEVAVSTCPTVGAVAEETLTTVVAEFKPSVLALLPVVSWLSVGNEVS